MTVVAHSSHGTKEEEGLIYFGLRSFFSSEEERGEGKRVEEVAIKHTTSRNMLINQQCELFFSLPPFDFRLDVAPG